MLASDFARLAPSFLNRIRVGFMGWLTVLLVVLGVAALLGLGWIHFGRR